MVQLSVLNLPVPLCLRVQMPLVLAVPSSNSAWQIGSHASLSVSAPQRATGLAVPSPSTLLPSAESLYAQCMKGEPCKSIA